MCGFYSLIVWLVAGYFSICLSLKYAFDSWYVDKKRSCMCLFVKNFNRIIIKIMKCVHGAGQQLFSPFQYDCILVQCEVCAMCIEQAIGMRRKRLSCNFFFRSKFVVAVKLRHADEKLIFLCWCRWKIFFFFVVHNFFFI